MNSHEHIHFFPLLFPIFVKLAQKNKIPYIRLGYKIEGENIIAFTLKILQKINLIILFFLNFFKLNKEKINLITTSQVLSSFSWFKNKDNFMKKIGNDSCYKEIIFHPEIKEEFNFLIKS